MTVVLNMFTCGDNGMVARSMHPSKLYAAAEGLRTFAMWACSATVKEYDVTVRAIRSDFIPTVLAAAAMATAYACVSPGVKAADVATAVVLSVGWILPYILAFNFSNQAVGAEEDRINKPYRPVPMGLITEHGAVVRSRVWSAVLVVAGLALNITPNAVLWIACINWYNFGSGSKHWFVKNQVFLVLSCLVGFAPIWLIAQNVWTEAAIAWTVAVCVYEALAVTVQDFRDVEGDLLQGRETLPILYGYKSRVLVGGIVAGIGATAPAMLLVNSSLMAVLAVLVFAVLNIWTAVLLLQDRGPKVDDFAYHVQEVTFCVMLGTAALWLQAPGAAVVV